MKQCSRCGRGHTGICGIPVGVTLSVSARVGGVGHASSRFPIGTKPKLVKRGTSVLEKLLEEARIQQQKVTCMLAAIPPGLPEYELLLDRLGKIEALIPQLNRQIIEKEKHD